MRDVGLLALFVGNRKGNAVGARRSIVVHRVPFGRSALIAKRPGPPTHLRVVSARVGERTSQRGALERELRRRSHILRFDCLRTGIFAGRDQARPSNYSCEPNRRSHGAPQGVRLGVRVAADSPQTSVLAAGGYLRRRRALYASTDRCLGLRFPASRRRFPSGGYRVSLFRKLPYGAAVAWTLITASLKSGSPGAPANPPSSMLSVHVGDPPSTWIPGSLVGGSVGSGVPRTNRIDSWLPAANTVGAPETSLTVYVSPGSRLHRLKNTVCCLGAVTVSVLPEKAHAVLTTVNVTLDCRPTVSVQSTTVPLVVQSWLRAAVTVICWGALVAVPPALSVTATVTA